MPCGRRAPRSTIFSCASSMTSIRMAAKSSPISASTCIGSPLGGTSCGLPRRRTSSSPKCSPRWKNSCMTRPAGRRPMAASRPRRSDPTGAGAMEFDNSFEVPLPIGDAWKVLMDIRRVAPCMPGAELTDVVDERTYRGKIGVRLGPVALTFAGTVKFEEIDGTNHKARVAAQGNDAKGRGAANAVASFHLEPASGGTKVLVHTNLTLSGAVAQYGRGVGIIKMTAAQIITQFANNLRAQLAQDGAANASVASTAPPPPASEPPAPIPQSAAPVTAQPLPPVAKPISGLALMANVLWTSLK